jgi:dihydroorotase
MAKKLRITLPDDWHVHLRDGELLNAVAPFSEKHFGRVLVMPNLYPPVLTIKEALAYQERIRLAAPKLQTLMTLYWHHGLFPEEIRKAKSHHIVAIKWYPRNATTHADWGIADWRDHEDLLKSMEEEGLVLSIHGEKADETDIFDREKVFLEKDLQPLLKRFPKLRIVLEHISSKEAVEFVRQGPKTLAATITPQHLLFNRNDLLAGGIRPHFYCLPILKTREDQKALVEAATSGHWKFFLGTDSAPHPRQVKESPCGCAGIFSSPFALSYYAEVFAKANKLEKLEDFASFSGADFYELPRSHDEIVLIPEAITIPEQLDFGHLQLVPLAAGKIFSWQAKP